MIHITRRCSRTKPLATLAVWPLSAALYVKPSMPTRNFYVSLSNRLRDHETRLKNLLVIEAIGGFILVVILSRIFDPKIVVDVGGKIWFSLTIIIAILYTSVLWFNPDRDKNDFNAKESMCVLMLNAWLLSVLWAWFFVE